MSQPATPDNPLGGATRQAGDAIETDPLDGATIKAAAARKPTRPPAPGTIVGERYRVVRLLGSGGSAHVVEAIDERAQRTVALKLMHSSTTANFFGLAELLAELRVAMDAPSSPHLLRVFDVGHTGDQVWLVMEAAQTNLATHTRSRGASLPTGEVIDVLQQVCAGLEALHSAGILHRDIKPQNILRGADGCWRLADFGISSKLEHNSGGITGTPAYMAPECFSEGRSIDTRADLYSVGVLACWLAAGHYPFKAGTIDELLVWHAGGRRDLRGLPARLSRVVERLMQATPADRPKTAREVASLLGSAKPKVQEVTCPAPDCGAPLTIMEGESIEACPLCDAALTLARRGPLVEVAATLARPFTVDRAAFTAQLLDWLADGDLTPDDLIADCLVTDFFGLFAPFYHFNGRWAGAVTCSLGYNRTVKEIGVEEGAKGGQRLVENERTITDWKPYSGHVSGSGTRDVLASTRLAEPVGAWLQKTQAACKLAAQPLIASSLDGRVMLPCDIDPTTAWREQALPAMQEMVQAQARRGLPGHRSKDVRVAATYKYARSQHYHP